MPSSASVSPHLSVSTLVTAPVNKTAIVNSSTSECISKDKIQREPAIETSLSPTQWSAGYKAGVTFLISAMALIATMGIMLVAPAAPQILTELGSSSSLDATLMITIWELGEAVSPVTLGPLSELLGRRLVYNIANFLLVVFVIMGALSDSVGMLIGSRFLSGFSIASTVLNSCIIGDIYTQDQRGTALSWMAMLPFLGPVLGPVIGGYISQTIGWRWNLWILAIVMGLLSIIFLLLVHETYLPVIVEKYKRQQQKSLSASTEQPPSDSSITQNLARLFRTFARPFQMLFRSPTIAIVSLGWSVTLTYMQIIINTLNTVYDDVYHFSLGEVGLSYLGLASGLVGGALLCGQTVDRYLKYQQRRHGSYRVRDRLPPIFFGTLFTCVAMLWFGWAVEKRAFWLVPILATALTGVAFTATAVGTQSYLVDSFGDYAASALAGAITIRNTTGAFLPLAAPTVWLRLEYGLGGTVWAVAGLVVLPAPILLAYYGPKSYSTTGAV